jgi:tetratricopeptide (TPR) repeat protein
MATDEDQHATDQREFLLGSLEDLEREHDAGDLTDDDYATLRDDYTSRAARALRTPDEDAVEDGAGGGEALRPGSRGRTLAIVAGVLAFAVLAGLLVASSLGARGQGDTATGGIDVQKTPNQRAQECQQLMNPTAPSEALDCFAGVLDDDPRNVVARTFSAWQLELASNYLPEGSEEIAAVQERVESLLDEAIELNPRYSYARAFRAIVAFRHGDPAAAKTYLDEFLANDPSADAKAIIEQFGLADQIEAELDGAATSTPSTSTTAPG